MAARRREARLAHSLKLTEAQPRVRSEVEWWPAAEQRAAARSDEPEARLPAQPKPAPMELVARPLDAKEQLLGAAQPVKLARRI
jgi:hypothetical protein